jgi:hypothetical protein
MVLTYEVCWSCAGSTVVDMQLMLSLNSGVDITVGVYMTRLKRYEGVIVVLTLAAFVMIH